MAEHTEHGADSFDMNEHVKTWHSFLGFIKWQIILGIVLLAVLLIWRTHN